MAVFQVCFLDTVSAITIVAAFYNLCSSFNLLWINDLLLLNTILYYFSHLNSRVVLCPDSTLTDTNRVQVPYFINEGQFTLTWTSCFPSKKSNRITSVSNSLWTLCYITYVIEFYICNDIPFQCITTKTVSFTPNLWYICLFLKKLQIFKAYFLKMYRILKLPDWKENPLRKEHFTC